MQGNPELATLSLGKLASTSGLRVESNAALATIAGLSALTTVTGPFTVSVRYV